MNWNARKSATLSLVVTWVGLIMALVVVVGLIPALKSTRIPGTVLDDDFVIRALGPLYACLVFGIIAMIVLLRLLGDIRRNEVFTTANVTRLRLISYCGFAITIACVVGAVITPIPEAFVLVALIAAFLGLLMRVIKNVIEAARLLKEDADYTI